MTSPTKLNEYNHAEEPALVLLERLGWTYVPREALAAEHVDATGMARNQAVHEYLTYGMPLTVDGPRGRDTRTVRFFDFDQG